MSQVLRHRLFHSPGRRVVAVKQRRLQSLAHRALAAVGLEEMMEELRASAADICGPCTVLLVQHDDAHCEVGTGRAFSPVSLTIAIRQIAARHGPLRHNHEEPACMFSYGRLAYAHIACSTNATITRSHALWRLLCAFTSRYASWRKPPCACSCLLFPAHSDVHLSFLPPHYNRSSRGCTRLRDS